jgi:hypothetical protein
MCIAPIDTMLRFTSSCFLLRALPLAALAALLAGAAPLHAQDSSLYGGVGYGAALLEDAEAASTGSGNQPETRAAQPAIDQLVATSVYGGFRLGPGLALEGSRESHAGAVAAAATPLGASAERSAVWSVSSVGSVPLDDSVSLFARLGLKYPENENPIEPQGQIGELGRIYGVGLRFAPSQHVDVRAEMQHVTRVGPAGGSDATAMVAARIRF